MTSRGRSPKASELRGRTRSPTSARSAADSGPGPDWRLALLGYGALTVLLTWPLALHFGDRLPLGANDLFQNVWNFWWWRECDFGLSASPYRTDRLFCGVETPLAYHTHSEGNLILVAPVLYLFGEVAALNAATFLGFVIAGMGGYALGREVLGDRRAAFLAGVVFAFFPQHFEQTLEHLNLASYGAMALFLAALLASVREGGWRWALTSVAFVANALFAWHNAAMVLPAACLLFLWGVWRSGRAPWLVTLEACASGALSLVLLVPFLWPMLSAALEGVGSPVKAAVDKPIDLAFLGIPPGDHTIWGALFRGMYEKWRSYASVGFVGYLGWTVLALAAAGVFESVRRWASMRRSETPPGFSVFVWLAIFVFYLVLSLGSELRVAGEDTGVPLPFAFLRGVMPFSLVRLAHRFLVPAMLALAILAAWGAYVLAPSGRRGGVLATALVAAVVIDYVSVPYPLRDVPRPAWVDSIAGAPPGCVLNIPGGFRARASEDMFLQRYHGRPIFGGYVSVTPEAALDRLREHPYLHTIQEGRPSVVVPAAEGLPPLLGPGIGVVVVHLDRSIEQLTEKRDAAAGRPEARLHNPAKGMPASRLDEARDVLREAWGAPAFADDEAEVWYRPTPAPRP